MIVLLSPSKEKLSEVANDTLDNFIFMDEFYELVNYMKSLTVVELQKIYKSSEAIAEENYERFQRISKLISNGEVGSAIYIYNGLQFRNINVEEFDRSDLEFMNGSFLILSALYGVLRPLDGIVAYRLDLNNDVKIGEHKNLYEFWGSKVYDYIISLEEEILCLASEEYKKLISKYIEDKSKLIEVKFGIVSGDKIKYHSTTSKIWKGKLINYIVKNRIENIAEIRNFREDGFRHNEELSNESLYVFLKE